nr:hypothetical protein [Dyella sp. ASV24]
MHGGIVDRDSRVELRRIGGDPRRRMICLVALLWVVSLSIPTGSALAQSNATGGSAGAAATPSYGRTEPVPPFEPNIFWAKVLALLDARGGFISAKSVENTFAAHLRTIRSDADGGFFATDDRPWYAGFGYTLRKVTDAHARKIGTWESTMEIRWGGFAKGSPQCLDMTEVLHSLEQRGGRVVPMGMGSDLSQPNVIRYRVPASGATVTIGYADIKAPFRRQDIADACLLDITIDGDSQRRN